MICIGTLFPLSWQINIFSWTLEKKTSSQRMILHGMMELINMDTS